MTLSRALNHVQMSYPCGGCGHVLLKPGSYFLSVPRFRCEGCGLENRITYDDRVRLQRRYADRLPKPL